MPFDWIREVEFQFFRDSTGSYGPPRTRNPELDATREQRCRLHTTIDLTTSELIYLTTFEGKMPDVKNNIKNSLLEKLKRIMK